ncbi:hypothetical protein JCM8097_002492 [Rhodosporidiobolus ruineniae]
MATPLPAPLPPSSSSSTIRPAPASTAVSSSLDPPMRFGPSSSKDRLRSASSTELSDLAANNSSPAPARSGFRSLFGSGAAGGQGKNSRPGLPRSASSGEVTSWRAGEGGGGRTPDERKASDASWLSGSSGLRFEVPPASQGGSSRGESGHARQRSSTTYSTVSRSTAASTFYSSSPSKRGGGGGGHAAYPSSSTSVPPASHSLARTASNASSSAASSEYPPTPAQNPNQHAGSVVYRSQSAHSIGALGVPYLQSKNKAKEPERPLIDEPSWRSRPGSRTQQHQQLMSAPASAVASPARRSQLPAVVDPRFSFPMRRGGPNGSSSSSGGNGSRGAGPVIVDERRGIGLGLGGAGEDAGRRSWSTGGAEYGGSRESGARDSGMSFIASLGSRPLVDEFGRPVPSFQSYAASPPPQHRSVDSTPDHSSPSLQVFSPNPNQPFSPTSPITSAFPSPDTPATSTLHPAFFPSTPPKPKPRSKRRGTFSVRRRKSSARAPSPQRRVRRRSSLSSARSTRGSSGLHTRTSSLPDLRRAAAEAEAAAGADSDRRPSIPIPFDTFQPRSARTRSPRQARTSYDSLLRSGTPLVFPSRPSGDTTASAPAKVRVQEPSAKPPRPPRSAARAGGAAGHARKASRPVVASGVCEAFTFAHPRVVVVAGSPESSVYDGEEGEEKLVEPVAGGKGKGKGKEVLPEGPLSDAEVDRLLERDFAYAHTRAVTDTDQSSVRRVMLEIEASRAERAAWSDSATKALGFGLSLRLADREREKRERDGARSAAAERRKAERKKVRQEVSRRKKREAAAAGESDAEGFATPRRQRSSGNLAVPGSYTPQPSPPMPTSFEPFAQLGRRLSFGRSKSRERRRPSDAGGTSDGVGIGFVGALRRKASMTVGGAAESRRPSGDSATVAGSADGPHTPRMATVRGQPIRHLRRSNSVDSLYERQNFAPGPSGRTLLYDDGGVATQFGEAISLPQDEPSPQKGEWRRPSVQTQNPFLTLPPHLHHLLRSPERNRFTPSRPAPPVPAGATGGTTSPRHLARGIVPSSSLPALAELDPNARRTSADSTASAARLSLALEQQLRESQRNSLLGVVGAKPVPDALPVATTPPLRWRSKDENDPPSRDEQAVETAGPSAATTLMVPPATTPPADPSPASPSSSPGSGAFSTWLSTAEDPVKEGKKAVSSSKKSTPTPPRSMRSISSPKLSGHSRQSSGSSALHMDAEGDFKNLFFSPPRPVPSPAPRRPSASESDASAVESIAAPPSENLRIGDVPVSPVEMRHRPFSMLSYQASAAGDEREELNYGSDDYDGRRRQLGQLSMETLFNPPATSTNSLPSIYATAGEPSSFSTARSGPAFLGRPALLPSHTSYETRSSTAQSTSYATADEGASSDYSAADLPDIVFPRASPASQTLSLPVETAPPVRPRPNPEQTPWPATSWAREYLGPLEADSSRPPSLPTPPMTARRTSGESSGQSFLQLGDDEGEEETGPERPIPSPSSFIDFSPPNSPPGSPTTSSSAPRSPGLPLSPTFSASSSLSPNPAASSDLRTSHLSVSTLPFIPPSRNSTYSANSGSRYSGLESRIGEFPRPPHVPSEVADSASDGDDEQEEDEDEEGTAVATIRFPTLEGSDSNTLHPSPSFVRSRPNSLVPQLNSLPTTSERPVSSQSYLDLSDSAASADEQQLRRRRSGGKTRRSSGSSWRSFFSNDAPPEVPRLPSRVGHARRSSWDERPEGMKL